MVTLALAGWLFALAAWDRFHLPQTPIADPDVWCYLNPPLFKLLGGAFQHTYGQCFLYPGMLYAILASTSDYRWIGALQHLLGLGTGALMLVAWRQAVAFLPRHRLPRILLDCAGLATAGVYLLSTTSTHFECLLRPEAVFPFFAVLNICCTLAFIQWRFHSSEGQTSAGRWWILGFGTAAVFTCVMTWLLKPSFSAMLILANLPIIISLFAAGSHWRDKLALGLLPTLLAGLLLVLPEAILRSSDPNARSFLAESLFTVHANLIADQIGADLADHQPGPYDLRWLGDVHAKLVEELSLSAENHALPSLGFDPDYLKSGPSFVSWLNGQLGKDAASAFYEYYYRRTWHDHPAAMLRKIVRQLHTFYRFERCPAYVMYGKSDLQVEYRRSAKIFVESGYVAPLRQRKVQPKRIAIIDYPATREFIRRSEMLGREVTLVDSHPWVRLAAAVLSAMYYPLCLGAILLGGICSLCRPVRQWAGPVGPMLLLLYAYNFGTTLSLSIGHTMDIGRYSMYQLSFTLLPEVVAFWLLLEGVLSGSSWLLGRYSARIAGGKGESLSTVFFPIHAPLGSPRVLETKPIIISYKDFAAQNPTITEYDLVLLGQARISSELRDQMASAYMREPADLIVATTLTKDRWIRPYLRLLRLATGNAHAECFGGPQLLSRRLSQSVSLPSSGRNDDEAVAIESSILIALEAAARGFRVRVLSVAYNDFSPPAAPNRSARWKLAGRLSVLCGRLYPLRCFGAAAVLCLLLAGLYGASSVHRKLHAHHRYTIRRSSVVMTGVLGTVGLASLVAMGTLEYRRRQWYTNFLLDHPPGS